MTDIICPLCGKPNPPDLDECRYCQAPLKASSFVAPPEEGSDSQIVAPGLDRGAKEEGRSSLEDAIPDWLKETEAGFLEPTEPRPEEPVSSELSEQIASLINPPAKSPEPAENVIDEEWLSSLLAEAGAVEPKPPEQPQTKPASQESETPMEEGADRLEFIPGVEPAQPTLPIEKPDWLTNLEASSKIKVEGGIYSAEPEQPPPETPLPEAESEPVLPEPPEWLTKASAEPPAEATAIPPEEVETPIAPAELPGWLEALKPSEEITPTGPVEDVSNADVITAGPLSGLRGVLSHQPSAIRAQKPPTYSIKLKVTEDQQARLKMMEELLADEEKPKPLSSRRIITTRNVFRLIVAALLILPIIWMIISNSRQTPTPQPGNIPGVLDFNQLIQALPSGAPVLVAFDYEAGFSGELSIATSNVITQLINKNSYLTLVATTSYGPALAESLVRSAISSLAGSKGTYSNYANLGYIPGGAMGLLGLVTSPKTILPYSLNEKDVWKGSPLNTISTVKNFFAVIVITNDPDTARIWIEQVGTQLRDAGTPLLFITSSQAEPLVRPYYETTPKQVQGLIAGLAGGVAYARAVGNYTQDGSWDAFSAGVTVSILIILVGSIIGAVKMLSVKET
jgi:hypothetical protein